MYKIARGQFPQKNKKEIFHKLKTGLSVLEYVFLVVVIVAVLITMSIYVRRAISGKWREMMDTFGMGYRYNPGNTTVRYNDNYPK